MIMPLRFATELHLTTKMDFGRSAAWAIVHSDDYEGALKFWEPFVDHIPDETKFGTIREKVELLEKVGEILKMRGNFDTALRLWKRFCERRLCSNVLNHLGLTYLEMSDYENAVVVLQQSTDIDKEDPEAWMFLYYAYIASKNYSEAIAAAQHEIEAQPTISAYRRLAAVYMAHGEEAKGNAAWEKAIALDPSEWLYRIVPKPWGNLSSLEYKLIGLAEQVERQYDDESFWGIIAKTLSFYGRL